MCFPGKITHFYSVFLHLMNTLSLQTTWPVVMGIVNTTPDSFYSPSRCNRPEDVVARLLQMQSQGAAVVDIGACSTRPDASLPSVQEEWARLEPVLRAIRQYLTENGPNALPPLSLDTFRPHIVEKAYNLIGPFWVNDVQAGAEDPAMLPLVAQLGLPWVAMHQLPYQNPDAVFAFFQNVLERAYKAGIRDVILDPGFGFHKTEAQNYALLQALDQWTPSRPSGTIPLLVGISRKRMTYKPFGLTPDNALEITSALHLQLLFKGASILRVHDVPSAVHIVNLFQKMTIFGPNSSPNR